MGSPEERVLLRVAVRLTGLLCLVCLVLAGMAGPGSRPIWLAVPLGIFFALLALAPLIARRRGVKPLAARLLAKVRRLAGRKLAAVRGARRRGRVRQVETAALEAARHDDLLAPDGVRESAESLFRLVQLALNARDPARLETLLSPELQEEWTRRLSDLKRRPEPREVVGDVRIEYVGFTLDDERPRTVVLIEATLRSADGSLADVCEYWTLEIREGLWTVLAVEGRAEGAHHLSEPIGAHA